MRSRHFRERDRVEIFRVKNSERQQKKQTFPYLLQDRLPLLLCLFVYKYTLKMRHEPTIHIEKGLERRVEWRRGSTNDLMVWLTVHSTSCCLKIYIAVAPNIVLTLWLSPTSIWMI